MILTRASAARAMNAPVIPVLGARFDCSRNNRRPYLDWAESVAKTTKRASNFVGGSLRSAAAYTWENKAEILSGVAAGAAARIGVKAILGQFVVAAAVTTAPAWLVTLGVGATAGFVAGGVTKVVRNRIAGRSLFEGVLWGAAIGACGGGLGAYVIEHTDVGKSISSFVVGKAGVVRDFAVAKAETVRHVVEAKADALRELVAFKAEGAWGLFKKAATAVTGFFVAELSAEELPRSVVAPAAPGGEAVKTSQEIVPFVPASKPEVIQGSAKGASHPAGRGANRTNLKPVVADVASTSSGVVIPRELEGLLSRGQFAGISEIMNDLPAKAQGKLARLAAAVAEEGTVSGRNMKLLLFSQAAMAELSKRGYKDAAEAFGLAGLKAARKAGLLGTKAGADLIIDHAALMAQSGNLEDAVVSAKDAMSRAIQSSSMSGSETDAVGRKAWGKVLNLVARKEPGLLAKYNLG